MDQIRRKLIVTKYFFEQNHCGLKTFTVKVQSQATKTVMLSLLK